VVALAKFILTVRLVQDGFQLVRFQVCDRSLWCALVRHPKHGGALRRRQRVPIRHKSEETVQRCEPTIARGDGAATILLQMIQESDHMLVIKVAQSKSGDLLAPAICHKPQK
jgi:hypothetical protein